MSEGHAWIYTLPCRGVVLQLSPAGASLLDFEKRDGIKRCGLHSVQGSLFHYRFKKVSHGVSEIYFTEKQFKWCTRQLIQPRIIIAQTLSSSVCVNAAAPSVSCNHGFFLVVPEHAFSSLWFCTIRSVALNLPFPICLSYITRFILYLFLSVQTVKGPWWSWFCVLSHRQMCCIRA